MGEIVRATANTDVHLVVGDLSDLASLGAAAADVAGRVDALDVLVHNAGALQAERTLSRDGIELTFATNVVGPFALTALLTESLRAGAPSRIVSVSSGGMYAQSLDVDDLQTERHPYKGAAVYARTKRAQIVLTEEWTRRLGGLGITAHAMHPGWVDTPGIEASLPRFHKLLGPVLRTPEEGADTIVWLGAAEEPLRKPGRFWHDRRERPTHRLPGTATPARTPHASGRRASGSHAGRRRRPVRAGLGVALRGVDRRDDVVRAEMPTNRNSLSSVPAVSK